MTQNRSFKDYIANRFYNELFDAVSSYLEQNHRNLDVSSQLVRTIDSAELSDIDIKSVFVDNLPGMKIAFDVLLEAEFEISETDRHTDRYDQKRRWFKVSCTGDLSCSLDDFAITATEEYNYRSKQNSPMSDSLVPIIHKDQLEAAIKKLNAAGIKCTVLTKGLLPTELAECSNDNEYGITLVSLDEGYRERIEPGAAPYVQRLASLRVLHEAGFKTWVSIEPYSTPNIITQDINKILEAVSFTDKIIFGRTNYSKDITAYKQHKQFYNEQVAVVIKFCEDRNIYYHIKEGTMT
jgi:hypothetical protein